MLPRIVLAFILCAACQGAEKKPAEGRAFDDGLEITARAFTDKDEVKKMLGSDFGGSIAVVEVRLIPKAGAKITVVRDDFVLRSDKDGQRSTPFAPSQIAGRSALIVSSSGGGAVAGTQGSGPIWGGPMERPRRLGGDGTVLGDSGGASKSTIQAGGKGEDPLLAVLEEKILPEKETTEPVGGLLYFFLEGKHKPKDVELSYRRPAGTLSLRFKN